MEDVCVNDSWNIGRISYAWQWKWTRITVTKDNSWVVIGISAVSGDVASQEYVKNVISNCKDERVSSMAEQVATLLLDNLYKWFGLPDKIISNWGPQFTSQSFKELLKLLGIKSALSTAYHPQTDGTTEQVNQEIEAYLSI